MIRTQQHRKNGNTYAYWTCNGYTHGRCRYPQGINDASFKSQIVDGIIAASEDSDAMLSAARRAIRRRAASKPYPSLLSALDARLERARQAYQSGVDTLEEYAATKRAIKAERDALLTQMNTSEPDESAIIQLAARFAAELRALADLLSSSASIEAKHEAAHSAIDSAIWDKSAPSLSILFNLD